MTFLMAPDGTRLHYQVEGDGPPLVLHAGAGCDSNLWRAAGYIEPLEKSYRCILFDHRGHGQSDRPRGAESNHINRYVGDVVALLDHLGLERAAFWGYSNGCSVGLKVAQDHPTRISALVGSDGVSRTTREQIAEIVARRVPEFREHGWEMLIIRFTEREPDGVPDWMKEKIRATDIQQFHRLVVGMARLELERMGQPSARRSADVACCGWARRPRDEIGKAAALMPNGSRFRVNGQGHINAFIKSSLVLPQVASFPTEHAV